MRSATEVIAACRVVPVVVLRDAAAAERLAAALVAGGLTTVEVTFRTDAAEEALRIMAAGSSLVVGAGTVVRAEQVDRAAAAGAQYIVCPGLSAAVVARAREHGLPVFPGVATPSEVMAAMDLGLQTLKLFPVSVLGGVAAVNALSAPFPGLQLIPTGGVSAATMADYLGLPAVVAVGGSWMVSPGLVRAGRFGEVTRLSAEAVALVKELS
jgi:2-dehydro-3-deoxyphosphogluconate aldolase / (4S)-4-hydroxy-2-oxoglutarate aldolase